MQLFESLKQLPKISGYTLSKNWKKDPHYVTNSLYTFPLSHQPKLLQEIMIFCHIYLVSYICISLNAIGYQVCVLIMLKPFVNLALKAMTLCVLSYDIIKQKKQSKNAQNNCREKLLNMNPRFSIWKNNFKRAIISGKVEVVLR